MKGKTMKSPITNQLSPKETRMRRHLTHVSTTAVGAVAILLLGMTATSGGQGAAASANIRPIEDFLNAQGQNLNGVPAPYNYVVWDDRESGLLLSLDYAGLANKWIEEQSGGAISLGTETDGKVIERPLPDGRAEVTVLLHTRNALTWVAEYKPENLPPAPPWGDLLFGHFPEQLLAGADPALGESFLKWVFINDAPGAPLPAFFDEALPIPPAPPPHQWIMISFEAQARGTLQEGFGVPDGTAGRAQMTQIGLFQTAGKGATADGYPVEHVKLTVVGR
jgi:hypothetical protein